MACASACLAEGLNLMMTWLGAKLSGFFSARAEDNHVKKIPAQRTNACRIRGRFIMTIPSRSHGDCQFFGRRGNEPGVLTCLFAGDGSGRFGAMTHPCGDFLATMRWN